MTEYEYELQIKNPSNDEWNSYFPNKTFKSLGKLIEFVAAEGMFLEAKVEDTRLKRTPRRVEYFGDEE